MRETLDQWTFVLAAYAVTIAATLALVGWSWLAMRLAERRRDAGRGHERGAQAHTSGLVLVLVALVVLTVRRARRVGATQPGELLLRAERHCREPAAPGTGNPPRRDGRGRLAQDARATG